MPKDVVTPLHEMQSEERLKMAKPILEAEGITDPTKQEVISFLMGVQESHFVAKYPDANREAINEANGNLTSDVEVLAKMMQPMITRGFGQSAAIEIAGTWPMKTDQGKYAYMYNNYTNDQANPVKPADSQVLVLASATGFAVGGDITSSGTAEGTVRIVSDNTLFVEVTAGTFAIGDSVDNANPYVAEATTVSAVYTPEIAQNVFPEYTKFASIVAGENATTTIKEVEINIGLQSVNAENHKLRMRYTEEFTAKVRDNYGIDVDALTNSVGSMSFKQELNRRVFKEQEDLAVLGGISSWDYDSDTDGRWEEEKIKTLMTNLNFKSSEIYSANFMIPGDYIVVDPIMYAFFSSYGYVDSTRLPNGIADHMTNAYVGNLNSTFRCYVNPWKRNRKIDMGSKDFSGGYGSQARAGLFFNPYLGLSTTSTIQDASGQPVKFFSSMYTFSSHPFSSTMGSNDFNREVNVTSLPNL